MQHSPLKCTVLHAILTATASHSIDSVSKVKTGLFLFWQTKFGYQKCCG